MFTKSHISKKSIDTIKGDKLFQFLTLEKYSIWRHIVANVLLFVFLFSTKVNDQFQGIYEYVEWLSNYLLIIGMLYFNMYVLVPKTLLKGNLIWYILSLVFSMVCVAFVALFLHQFWFNHHLVNMADNNVNPIRYMLFAMLFLMPFVSISTALKFFRNWSANTEKLHDLEIKTMEIEMEALHNQIQPHFLFNMLNSIKVLIKSEPETAEQITMKLSGFLRYLLYENNREKVYLTSEIRFLTDYLSFEKMRRDNFEYTINYNDSDVKGVQLPPNILLIFVENAVKHSHDPQDESYVDIDIRVDDGNLSFLITNSIPTISKPPKKDGGVGLANMQRRLELLYGERFYINSSKNSNEYIATLKLPL